MHARWRRRGLRTVGTGLLALSLLLAAGCGGDDGGSEDGKVTIRYSWWGGKDRAELINKTIDLFRKKYPDIEVKTDFQEYGDFWTKFNTQAAGGNGPDVFQNSYAFLRKYGDKNLLLDLNSQAKAGNLDMSGFRAGLDKVGEVDGKLYGVPVGSNTFALFYNADAFTKAGVTPKPGWTWNDYYAGIRKVAAANKGMYAASDNAGVMYFYDLFLRQNGKAFYTADSQLGFTEADLKQWWGDHFRDNQAGLYVPAKKSDQVKPKSSLSAGLSASEFSWDNFLVRYSSETKTKLALGPIPTTDGTKTGQYLSSLMLSGSARTKHAKEVAQFITFMTHDPEVGKIMGYNRGVLATEAQFNAFQPSDPVNAAIAQYEKDVAAAGVLEPITPHPAGTDVAEASFLRIYGEISSGTTPVDKGVSTFFSEAKTALAG